MKIATVIADSISSHNHRLTTLEVIMPRIILAEFNTHKAFSRNSASSRAIPFPKMLKAIEETPFVPIKWMKDHKGMQGSEYFEEERVIELFKEEWTNASRRTMFEAKQFSEKNLTKQIVNRLLEPFMYHKVLVSATEWENFFAQRAESHAEIHMQQVAYAILDAMNESTPKRLKGREWHIPYLQEAQSVLDQLDGTKYFDEYYNDPMLVHRKISTALCAGVSYTIAGEDGKPLNYEKLIERHDMLLTNGHMSPFEHIAQAMTDNKYYNSYTMEYVNERERKKIYGASGNFRGFMQYRKMIPGENKSDTRLIKKY